MHTASCCGKVMSISVELGKFTELLCTRCGDTIYVQTFKGLEKGVQRKALFNS